MKSTTFLILMVIIFAISSCEKMNTDNAVEEKPLAQSREFYQLKTYTFDTDEQVQTTESYLKEAYLPGLKKLGIKHIGVFKPRPDEADSTKKILVFIPFSSMEQFLNLEEELANDESYLAAGSGYINASHEQPPYQRIESIILKAFEDMPVMQTPALDGPRSDRIYELRSYESPTEGYYKNKVDMFNAGGEIRLFDRLEFNAVFYGEVISGPKMPNLMYMTTFSDQTSRDEHWSAFIEAPEWKELIAMSKYKNNVSHADIIFLYPTEYSDY
ncbi:MAG: NIPSNAP family protein [Cyclobacteriaceae bacterium]|nr:NIPSNAP family protein [Cyclobacteriaceae bacterium]